MSYAQPVDLPTELTLSQLATLLKITPQAVNSAERAGIFKKLRRGTYPISAIGDYAENLRKTISGAGAGLGLTEARALLVAQQTKKVRIEVEALEGTLVKRDLVLRDWMQVVIAIRNQILGLGTKLVPRLMLCASPAAMQEVIDGEADQILDDLANAEFEFTDAIVDDETPLVPPSNGNGAEQRK